MTGRAFTGPKQAARLMVCPRTAFALWTRDGQVAIPDPWRG
jgi:hypothetical protein